MCSYDLTHGMLADYLALPPTNAAGQERRMVQAVRSAKQSAWLAFAKVGPRAGGAASMLFRLARKPQTGRPVLRRWLSAKQSPS